MTYIGECRKEHNILQQWNGAEWVRVPEVAPPWPEGHKPNLHFGPEDNFDRTDPADIACVP